MLFKMITLSAVRKNKWRTRWERPPYLPYASWLEEFANSKFFWDTSSHFFLFS